MIWISSFPRSGNTFLRNILFEVYGIESSTFHRETTYPLDPGYDQFDFVKAHELPSNLIPFDASIPAVYLLRDGRDAVCSMAYHRTDIVAPGSDYYQNLKEAIIADRGSFFGGWSRNAQAWLQKADLIIRYEDLVADPINSAERLRAVYELPEPDITKLPTFEQLKFGIPKYGVGRDIAISEKEKREHSKKFFRKGKSGSWKEDMPDELHDLFWSYHGETMEAFGYTREGSITQPDPELGFTIRQKLGISSNHKPERKYRVLIESNKIVSPDNDGVKRYQMELLRAFLPVTLNPNSKWQIDLYVHGEIRALRDFKETLDKGFHLDDIDFTDDQLKAEQKLESMAPRGWVNYLRRYYINIPQYSIDCVKYIIGKSIELREHATQLIKLLFHKLLKRSGDGKFDTYDLIHLPLKHHYGPFKDAKVSFLTTIHDLSHLYFPECHTKGNIRNSNAGLKFAAARNSHVIAISKSTQKDIIADTNVSKDKIDVIYEAADREKFNFKINREDSSFVKQKYGIYSDNPYLICLSTLEPRKNLENTIRAFALLRKRNPDLALMLVVAGKKGWNTKSIFAAASDFSEYIIFTGFVDDDDIAYLYSEAVALSYLSFHEGFGLPPLEAMSCGTPVIYGNNSSLIEVVGEGGLPADPNDIEDIQKKFAQIFFDKELRAEKSRAALKQSLNFSWRHTAIQTLGLYERIIENNT